LIRKEEEMKKKLFLETIMIVGMLLALGCKRTPSGGGTVFGKVVQYGSRKPMANAQITVYSVEGLRLNTTTDNSGNYSIANIPPGSYKVRAYLQGYHLNEIGEEIYIEKGKKKIGFELVIVGGGT